MKDYTLRQLHLLKRFLELSDAGLYQYGDLLSPNATMTWEEARWLGEEVVEITRAAVGVILTESDPYPDEYDCRECGVHVTKRHHPYYPFCLRCIAFGRERGETVKERFETLCRKHPDVMLLVG